MRIKMQKTLKTLYTGQKSISVLCHVISCTILIIKLMACDHDSFVNCFSSICMFLSHCYKIICLIFTYTIAVLRVVLIIIFHVPSNVYWCVRSLVWAQTKQWQSAKYTAEEIFEMLRMDTFLHSPLTSFPPTDLSKMSNVRITQYTSKNICSFSRYGSCLLFYAVFWFFLNSRMKNTIFNQVQQVPWQEKTQTQDQIFFWSDVAHLQCNVSRGMNKRVPYPVKTFLCY